MKRVLLLVLVALLLNTFAIAEVEVDIDSMTEDELMELRSAIDVRLSEMHTFVGQVQNDISDGVIYDKRDCRLTVVDINQDECRILIENNSSIDYDFCVHALAINGMMTDCNPYLASTNVSSGKKAYMTIEFDSYLLEYKPEGPYNNIQVLFWAYDNAKSYKDFETAVISIPINPDIAANSFEMGADIVEECGLSISPISFSQDSITIAVVNNNPYYVDFDLKETSINGWSFDTGISVYDVCVFPESQTLFTVEFDKEFMEDCAIESVENFEFKLGVRESGDYFNETTTRAITFNP